MGNSGNLFNQGRKVKKCVNNLSYFQYFIAKENNYGKIIQCNISVYTQLYISTVIFIYTLKATLWQHVSTIGQSSSGQ